MMTALAVNMRMTEEMAVAVRMNWKDIQKAYPDRWVGLVDVHWINESNVDTAIVKYTDKSGDELLELQLGDEPDLFGCYTTPDHVAHVGVAG